MTRIPFEHSIELLTQLHHQPLRPAREVGLRRIRRLLGELGNPESAFRSVHVAGSSGKGSTTTMIGNILSKSGVPTGFFRSPHLESYRERISTNEGNISSEDWEITFGTVWPIVEAMVEGRMDSHDLGRPSHGEVLFAMMATYFARSRIAWAAVETGLGGRLDATNVLNPDVAVVTNISLEHTQILGATVEAIAAEKAAIIKVGCDAVTATIDPGALQVIRDRARNVDASLITVPADVRPIIDQMTLDSEVVLLEHNETVLQAELHMAGGFQAVNAATAYASALALRARGINVDDDAVVDGLADTRVPGRFEILSRDPLVVVDGAHNPAAARELRLTVDEVLHDRRVVLLIAAMADKDLAGIAAELAPVADSVIVTSVPGSDRGAFPDVFAEEFARRGMLPAVEPSVDEALSRSLERLDQGDVLLVCGSLYLVGQVRAKIAVPAGST